MIVASCLLLTSALLLYIFSPRRHLFASPEATRIGYLRERKDVIYENLRDLNFDFKAGKLPDADYTALRAGLEQEAAVVLAEIDHLESSRPTKGLRP